MVFSIPFPAILIGLTQVDCEDSICCKCVCKKKCKGQHCKKCTSEKPADSGVAPSSPSVVPLPSTPVVNSVGFGCSSAAVPPANCTLPSNLEDKNPVRI